MKYSAPNHSSTLEQDILSKFIKYDNSPDQLTKSHNTTEEIAESLGVEQNETVGWTSALETPHIDEEKKSKQISTIESFNLHPTRVLRQRVLARALFSPLLDNSKEGSSSSTSHAMSPLALNLESPVTSRSKFNGCKSNLTMELEEPARLTASNISFDQTNKNELTNDTIVPNNINFTSIALTSTPISVKNSEYQYTNHLKKCLDDAFSRISPRNKLRNLERENVENISNTVEEFNDISYEQKYNGKNIYGKYIIDENKNSNSVAMCETNISKLCFKSDHVNLSFSSNDKINFKSRLSLKRKRSKFVYPSPEEILNYESEASDYKYNLQKIADPVTNKLLKQQPNVNSLSSIKTNINPTNVQEDSNLPVCSKLINNKMLVENEKNIMHSDELNVIASCLAPCDIAENSLRCQNLFTDLGSKNENYICKKDSSFQHNNNLTHSKIKEGPMRNVTEFNNLKDNLTSNYIQGCFQSPSKENLLSFQCSPSRCADGNLVESITILNSDSKETVSPKINLSNKAHIDCNNEDVSLCAKEILYKNNNENESILNRSVKTVNGQYKSFTGFLSGSGKKIGISETSLRNVKKLWSECNQPNQDIGNLRLKTNTGFQTVSGKKITVEEKSLNFVQTMWEECSKPDNYSLKLTDISQSSKMTASTKPAESLIVSESSALSVPYCALQGNLTNSYKSLDPVTFNNHDGNSLDHDIKECEQNTAKFITDKKTVVSMFKNSEKSTISSKEPTLQTANLNDKLIIGATFSDLQLDKGTMLNSGTPTHLEENLNYQKSTVDYRKSKNKLCGNRSFMSSKGEIKKNDFVESRIGPLEPKLLFQTASNKPVEISKGALLKAKMIWNDIDNDINVKEFDSQFSKPDIVKNEEVKVTTSPSFTKTDERRSLSPVFGSFRSKRHSCKSKVRKRSLVPDFICSSELDTHNMDNLKTATEGRKKDADHCNTADIHTLNLKQTSKFQFVTGSGKNVDIKEDSLLKVKNLLNQKLMVGDNLNLDKNDHAIIEIREVPNASNIINCENKYNNEILGNLNSNNFLETQDFIEINKISEAFLLDNSWDDLSQPHKSLPSSAIKQGTSESELSHIVKRKRKRIEDTSDKDYENLINSKEKAPRKLAEITHINSKGKVDNVHGFLYQMKVNKELNKVKLSSFNLIKDYIYASQFIEKIMPQNATNWRFDSEDKICFSHDGFNIIPGCDNKIGVEEIEKAFIASPCFNSSLVTVQWVSNHYKWIIWKLASYQRKLDCFNDKLFSLIETIKQLRYRYDIEMLEGRRSVLRKIYEQDDLPQKTMILCVSEINIDKTDANLSPIVLTDGWYSIGAQIDSSMMNLLQRNVIKVGYKLILHGSELVGTPSPCHPLENNETIQLKIHTNMIRMASWHSKLGLYKCRGPIPTTNISCILDGGGIVGTLDVMIARKYPLIYMEKICGKTVMYNEKSHDKKTQDGEIQKQTLLQEIYSQVSKELEDEENGMPDLDFIKDMPNREEIYKNISLNNDSNNLESLLLPEELIEVHKWKLQKRDERNSLIQKEVRKRFEAENKLCDSVPMLKLGVVDKNGNNAIITIWRPQDDIVQLIKEGKSYRVHFVTAAEMRSGIKQMIWNKHSRILEIRDISVKSDTHHRKVTPIDQVNFIAASDVVWSEMDVVGIVVRITEPRDGRQVVFLADDCANILSLKFWPSIYDFGMGSILEVGSWVSVCNASWKGKCEGTPTLHITSHTVILGSPSKQYLKEAMQNVRGKVQDISQFLAIVNSKIEETCKEVPSLSEPSRQQLSPKFARTEIKRSKEIIGKINTLTKHYGIPSPIQTLQLKSSPLITKPFKVPQLYDKSHQREK